MIFALSAECFSTSYCERRRNHVANFEHITKYLLFKLVKLQLQSAEQSFRLVQQST
jgi:hypothetical protein